MTAVMIDDGKRVAADGARLQWHTVPIADIELIARNTRGEENGLRLGASHSDTCYSENAAGTAATIRLRPALMRSLPRDLSVPTTDLTVHLARSHGSVRGTPT